MWRLDVGKLNLLHCTIGTVAIGSVIVGCAGASSSDQGSHTDATFFCATPSPTKAESARIEKELKANPFEQTGDAVTVTIPVYVHVITDSLGNGAVSDSAISSQIAVLNTAFSGSQSPGGFNTGFRFQFVRTDRSENDAWFRCARGSADEIAMKTQLRQGSADDLNIYIRDLPDGLMGYGGFPWWYSSSPLEDGPSIDYTGMYGGSSTQFNLGDLAVHEVGHWLGLYHTFEGGCTRDNDFVDDTPAEANYNWTCPSRSVDTCTGSQFRGTDPTMNFMDYTTDSCKWQFTKGQNTRMVNCWNTYRAGK